MLQEPQAIDYEQFCMPPKEGYTFRDLNEPFTIGEHTYCTDGIIAIRLDGKLDSAASGGRYPDKVEHTFEKIAFHGDGIEVPRVEGPPEGADKWWGEEVADVCDCCRGTGDCECNCGHTHECQACDGEGEVRYYATASGGEHFVKIGEQRYQRQFVWRISTLPNARVFPDCLLSTNTGHALPFKFDGGIGLLMPISG